MPFTQPKQPNPERFIPLGDGSYRMTLLPSDPDPRLEWAWARDGERLPMGEVFNWRYETALVESTVPRGHEWCIWQWHANDEPALANSNPFLRLIVKDGIGAISLIHEFSEPYNKAKQTTITIAPGLTFKPGVMSVWQIEAKIGLDGFVKVRRDGLLIADYQGPFGFNMEGLPYAKAGIYKWDRNWTGRIVVRVRPSPAPAP